MFYFTFLFSVPKAKSSPSKIVHMPATQQALHQTPTLQLAGGKPTSWLHGAILG